jgi:uncharacterized repeat protein (TIGR01451 family)
MKSSAWISSRLSIRLGMLSLALLVALGSLSLDAAPLAGAAASPEARLDGLLSAPASGDALAIALDYLRAHAGELGLSPDDLADVVVTDRYVSRHNGVTHLYLRQRLDGLEVANSSLNINLTADGQVINVGNRFVANLRAAAEQPPAGREAAPGSGLLPPADALAQVAGQLGLQPSNLPSARAATPAAGQPTELIDPNLSQDPIPVRLVYQRVDDASVRLAWEMRLRTPDDRHWYEIAADAESGAILAQFDRVIEEPAHETAERESDGAPTAPQQPSAATAPQAGEAGEAALGLGPAQASVSFAAASQGHEVRPSAVAPRPGVPNSGSYLVYALPSVNPWAVSRTLVVDPADPVASPYGWHDTNSAPGAEHSVTRGNNAFAYADMAAPDGFGPGDETFDGGPGLVFSPTLDLATSPVSNTAPGITNLFYLTNRAHDIFYHYGFDEASGNFQHNNYGRGGAGGDAIMAETLDPSGHNNGRFWASPDGHPGQIEVFRSIRPFPHLTVNTPPTITVRYSPGGNGTAAFGPQSFAGPSGDVVRAEPADGCAPLTNAAALAGKIAFLERGSCPFMRKVAHAQVAGASAALVGNNVPRLTQMDFDPSVTETITIPSLFVPLEAANAMRAELLAGRPLNVSMGREDRDRDGAFENILMLHEYAHGVSFRLVGGPSTVSCLSNAETQKEGYSDFLALALTTRPGQSGADPIYFHTWLAGENPDGKGTRNYPFSTDMALNPLTYDSLKQPVLDQIGEVHDVGEVWNAMLWDAYWDMVGVYGFDPDVATGDGGNNRMIQLVIDGMKLQPCNASFVEARDAILAADRVNSGGANQCLLWQSFARRGLGYSASAADADSVTDGEQAFDLPPGCTLGVRPQLAQVCAPDPAQFAISVGPSAGPAVALSARGLPPGATASFSANPATPTGTTTLSVDGLGGLPPDLYLFDLLGAGESASYTATLAIHLADAPPEPPAILAPADGATVQLQPRLRWQGGPLGTTYLVELARDAAFSQLVYSDTVLRESIWLPSFLGPTSSYHWRVSALNGCGRSAPSPAARITAVGGGPLLLVDDDANKPEARVAYTQALDELGVGYDVWDTRRGTPDAGDLAPYASVIWFSGELNAPSAEARVALADYLERGRCLMLSSQELFWHTGRTVTPFMSTYLGVLTMTDNLSSTLVFGSGPQFGGLGPYALGQAAMRNFSDQVTPDATAQLVFFSPDGGLGIAKDGGRFRTIFLPFAFSELGDAATRRDLLARIHGWCAFQSDAQVRQAVAPEGDLLPGQPITYTLRFRNTGALTATGVRIDAELPKELSEVAWSSSGAPLTVLEGRPLAWGAGNLAPGAGGTITVTGVIGAKLAADRTITSSVAISTTSTDLDLAPNRVATPLRVRLPRVSLGEVARAEGGRIVSTTVKLDRPTPYVAVSVPYSVSGLASGEIAPTAGTLTIPPGATSAVIVLTLAESPLAGGERSAQLQLGAPSGALLQAPSTLRIGFGASESFIPLLLGG